MSEAEPTDEELMARYVDRGDAKAFETLFKRYSGRLFALFLRSVPSRDVAADLVQQTFLHVHRARKDFQRGRTLRPWVYTIAINLRREYFRRRKRKPETSFDPVVHGEPAVSPDATSVRDRMVRRALAQLPDNQREVIILHWYQDLSFPEISEALGASLSAVKVRAHRGYNRLRDLLGEEQG